MNCLIYLYRNDLHRPSIQSVAKCKNSMKNYRIIPESYIRNVLTGRSNEFSHVDISQWTFSDRFNWINPSVKRHFTNQFTSMQYSHEKNPKFNCIFLQKIPFTHPVCFSYEPRTSYRCRQTLSHFLLDRFCLLDTKDHYQTS